MERRKGEEGTKVGKEGGWTPPFLRRGSFVPKVGKIYVGNCDFQSLKYGD